MKNKKEQKLRTCPQKIFPRNRPQKTAKKTRKHQSLHVRWHYRTIANTLFQGEQKRNKPQETQKTSTLENLPPDAATVEKKYGQRFFSFASSGMVCELLFSLYQAGTLSRYGGTGEDETFSRKNVPRLFLYEHSTKTAPTEKQTKRIPQPSSNMIAKTFPQKKRRGAYREAGVHVGEVGQPTANEPQGDSPLFSQNDASPAFDVLVVLRGRALLTKL